MAIWGISALSHDASITVIDGKDILFAGHSERYSKQKNDKLLNQLIVSEALKHGAPDEIVWFEKPFTKKARQVAAGEWAEAYSNWPKKHLGALKKRRKKTGGGVKTAACLKDG